MRWQVVKFQHCKTSSLNPYSIGRYSMSPLAAIMAHNLMGLNTYSIGRYSMRHQGEVTLLVEWVLILILLEDTLWGMVLTPILSTPAVLILILLEDTLWVLRNLLNWRNLLSLNPYSIGRYSMSLKIINPSFLMN